MSSFALTVPIVLSPLKVKLPPKKLVPVPLALILPEAVMLFCTCKPPFTICKLSPATLCVRKTGGVVPSPPR